MAKRRRRCTGKTTRGARCQAWPLRGTKRCAAHPVSPDSARFGSPEQAAAAGAKGGRPRLPRPHEVLREKIEGDLERWLAPLEDALNAERAIVVGSGESAEIERVPDHKIRLQATREAHDRVYGKPKQQVELGGSEVPIRAEIVAVDERTVAEATHEFLRKLSGGTEPGG